jgi:hypothetical protein
MAKWQFGPLCAQNDSVQDCVEISRVARKLGAQQAGRLRSDERKQSNAVSRRGGITSADSPVMPSSATRLLPVWQWPSEGTRAAATAPFEAGPERIGEHRLDTSLGRCPRLFPWFPSVMGFVAAVRELSVDSHRVTPRILSVIRQQAHRNSPPSSISGGGAPRSKDLRAALCPTRTRPPQSGHQTSFRRTLKARPGTTGVDSSKGAAIHSQVVLGEPE